MYSPRGIPHFYSIAKNRHLRQAVMDYFSHKAPCPRRLKHACTKTRKSRMRTKAAGNCCRGNMLVLHSCFWRVEKGPLELKMSHGLYSTFNMLQSWHWLLDLRLAASP